MKYTNEIDIELPVDRVIELFDNPDNLSKWMEGLQSFEHVSGEPGKVGAKSRLVFKHRNRDFEMIETLTVYDPPRELSGTYEMKGTWNGIKNSFHDLGGGRTKYVCENEFKFDSLMMRIMSKIMPGAFKKQSLKFMQAFKHFAEDQGPGSY